MTSANAFSAGYFVGFFGVLVVLALIFWHAGRWGWVGLIIRIVCAALFLLRILAMLANPPTF